MEWEIWIKMWGCSSNAFENVCKMGDILFRRKCETNRRNLMIFVIIRGALQYIDPNSYTSMTAIYDERSPCLWFRHFWHCEKLFLKPEHMSTHDNVMAWNVFLTTSSLSLLRKSGFPQRRPVIRDCYVSLLLIWTSSWTNNRSVGDLKRHDARANGNMHSSTKLNN